MTTYQDSGYRYWYDRSLRMWTIYPIDESGNQLAGKEGVADYHATRERLTINLEDQINKYGTSN